MVEQAHAGEGHGDAVFVASLDDVVVAHAASGLRHILHAALVRALDVVAEGEEGVRAEGHAGVAGNPFLLFLACERFGAFGEELLPLAVGQHVHIVVADVDVDGVVAVGAADFLHERQRHHFRVLAEPPDVGLVAGQAGAVDAALLSRADADGLSVLHVADGVALGVLQGDEGNHQVALRLVREGLVGRRDVLEQGRVVQFDLVAPLLEGDAEHLFVFHGGRHVVRVNLDDVVGAFALFAQDLERFFRVVRRYDPVAHLSLDEGGGGGVARVAQGDEVAIARHAVGPACACVGAGQGGERNLHVVHEIDFPQRVAQGQADGGPGGGDVLEGSGGGQACGLFQFLDQLPAVEGVQEVDVSGASVQHFNG